MGWIISITKIIICIFEIYMLFDFSSAFLEAKSWAMKRKKEIILVFAVIVFVINSFESTIINLIFVPMIWLQISILPFLGDMYKKILGGITAILVAYGGEFALAAILSLTAENAMKYNNEPTIIMMTVLSKLITFIIFTIIKQFAIKTTARMDIKTFMMYIIVPFSSLGLMITVMYCDIDFDTVDYVKIILIAFFVILLIGNASIFYGFNKHAEVVLEKELSEKNILRQQLKLESYEKLDEANNRYATLLHDTNHNIKTIYGLLVHNKVNEATEILQQLSIKYAHAEMIEYSGNTILNAILSDYKNEATKKGIDYDVFVEPGFNIEYVDELDLVTMIGNLLSNAFEAASKSDLKTVKIKMFMQNDGSFSVIKIQNSYFGDIESNGETIYTTKSDKKNHGFGIESIKEMSEKYNGYLHNAWQNGIFKSVLALENSNYKI